MSEDTRLRLVAEVARAAAHISAPLLRVLGLSRRHAPPGIGPHEGRELALFIEGRKPLAILDQWGDHSGFDRLVAEGRACLHTILVPIRVRRTDIPGRLLGLSKPAKAELRFYASQGNEWRLQAIANIYTSHSGLRQFTTFEHATIGWLLGYSDVEIAAFLEWSAPGPAIG